LRVRQTTPLGPERSTDRHEHFSNYPIALSCVRDVSEFACTLSALVRSAIWRYDLGSTSIRFVTAGLAAADHRTLAEAHLASSDNTFSRSGSNNPKRTHPHSRRNVKPPFAMGEQYSRKIFVVKADVMADPW
jgi:hypothetical protein